MMRSLPQKTWPWRTRQLNLFVSDFPAVLDSLSVIICSFWSISGMLSCAFVELILLVSLAVVISFARALGGLWLMTMLEGAVCVVQCT